MGINYCTLSPAPVYGVRKYIKLLCIVRILSRMYTITILSQHICTQTVPELHHSMKQGKATHNNVQREIWINHICKLEDLVGLESAISSALWIKIYGKRVKMPFMTSIIAQNHHTTRCAPCMLFQHICTRIVPAGWSKERRPVDLSIGGDDMYYQNFYLIKNRTGRTLNQWPNIFTPVHWILTMPVY